MKKEYDLLDVLNILSFVIGLENLESNMTQNDKQDLIESLDKKTRELTLDIHSHLDAQDKMLKELLDAKNKKASR